MTTQHIIPIAADGYSDHVILGRGTWVIDVVADTWASGATVALQSALQTLDGELATWSALPDPMTGDPVVRTALGPQIAITAARTAIRADVSAIGASVGLRIVARRSRP